MNPAVNLVTSVAVNQPQHASLGPALFQLIGTVVALIWIWRIGMASKRGEKTKEEKQRDTWAAYMRAHPNRDNKAGDVLKAPKA